MKKALSLITLIIWMGVIFLISSLTRVQINGLNRELLRQIRLLTGRNIFRSFGIRNPAAFLRGNSHFIIYFILGILMFNCLKQFGLKYKYPLAILLSIICAMMEEAEQILITGRLLVPLNIVINAAGAFLAVGIIYAAGILQKRKYYKLKHDAN